MSSKHKEKDRERDRRDRSRSRTKDGGEREKKRSTRDKSRDREKTKDKSERRERRSSRDRDRSSRDRDESSRARSERRSKSRERDRRRRRNSRSRSKERRSRDRDHERDRRREKEQRVHGAVQGVPQPLLAMRNLSPPAPQIDQEMIQLQMVQSMIQKEPKLDLAQVILEAVAASTRAASKNFADMFNCHSNGSGESMHGGGGGGSESTRQPVESGNSSSSNNGEARAKKKKSRWGGSENDKTFIPGMPTILPATLDSHQQEAYLVQLQIEEISRKLRTGDLTIANSEERSPSPEPIYSADGKRLNTREFRTRKRLEEQRHQLVVRMQCMNPEFKPPADYKPPVVRVSDKVLIPQEEHPDINFVGLLIGPRGNTLKAMEKETGAKIIIRGKGSVKEGKVGRKDGQPLPGEDEPLHAFITAANPECVKKAVDKIKDVIRQGIEVPEGHNDLRRMQLRELAQLNGTLRETDGPRCTNCGSTEHKSWLCPDKPNITNNIVCSACGGAGHIAKDCRSKRPGQGGPPCANAQAKIDEEYLSLMAELGEGPPPKQKEIDPLVQAQLSRGNYSLFDRPNAAPRAIAAPPPLQHAPAWTPQNMPPPLLQAPSTTQQPPAQGVAAPPPGPPPLMPWMTSNQPAPPGHDIPGMSMPLPPGTGGSMAPPGTQPTIIPPPPGTTNGSLPPWGAPQMMAPPPPQFPWGNAPPQFIPPPPGSAPPPPPGPPPGVSGGLLAPPPPPPPN